MSDETSNGGRLRIEGPAWTRANAIVPEVKPGRTVEIVVIPYDSPAVVGWDGRRVSETIDRAAFDGIQRRPTRIHANRDHDVKRLVGRAVTMHPNRDVGLVAEIKVSQTPIGDETLELCRDGALFASAGFVPAGIRWDGPDDYTITKAFLRHVAFTPDPAHDGTDVIAIRSTGGELDAPAELVVVSSTPLLDQWRAQLAADAAVRRAASLHLA